MYDIVLIFKKVRGKHTGTRQYVRAISSEGYIDMCVRYAERRGYKYIDFMPIEYAEGIDIVNFRLQKI